MAPEENAKEKKDEDIRELWQPEERRERTPEGITFTESCFGFLGAIFVFIGGLLFVVAIFRLPTAGSNWCNFLSVSSSHC